MVGRKYFTGCPSRQEMVKAAIFMERRGFTFSEWAVVWRLCDSSPAIRGYILSFAAECLDVFEGQIPHRGHRNCEIALIAAFNAYKKARKEIGQVPDGYIDSLLEPPEPWTSEQKEMALQLFRECHPDNVGVTATLLEALEQEAAMIYEKPYTTKSGCTLIPFGPKMKEARTKI